MIRRSLPLRRTAPLKRSSKPIKRGKKPGKVRKTTLAAEKRGLWREFSDYIRNRDGWTCFTCDRQAWGVHMHAGHLFSRRIQSVLFDFRNVHAQDASCNRGLRGNVPEYISRFIERYGQDEFDRLTERARRMKQWTLPEIQALRAALKRSSAEFECLYAEKYMCG